MPTNEKITGIILAGGKNSRMGFDKGLMDINGKQSIELVMSALQPVTDKIIIISNNNSYNYLRLPVFEDIYKDCGPLGGIYTGLKISDSGKNLVVACDMPFVSSSLLSFIIENSEYYEIAVPVFNNDVQPLCGLYYKHIKKRIEVLIKKQMLKMEDALPHFHVNKINIKSTHEFYNPKLSMNINTPEELKKVRETEIKEFKSTIVNSRFMKIKVMFFGYLVDIAGNSKINLELDSRKNSEKLKNILEEKYPRLKNLKYLISVNQQIATENTAIYNGDEIALLPPFSGG